MKDKVTMLMILDGFGDNKNKDGNAIKLAKTPNIDKLMKKYPNYTIRAIADESGFNSAPILYNLFKKKTGMTPYEFKKAQDTLRN